jgi:hypothetical protein
MIAPFGVRLPCGWDGVVPTGAIVRRRAGAVKTAGQNLPGNLALLPTADPRATPGNSRRIGRRLHDEASRRGMLLALRVAHQQADGREET